MSNAKPWYLSKTVWASIVTIGTAVSGMIGIPAGVIANSALTDTIFQAVTAISGLVAIFGRLSATSQIG